MVNMQTPAANSSRSLVPMGKECTGVRTKSGRLIYPGGPSRPTKIDIVQFTAPIYYLDEADGKITVDVMRIGSFTDRISVNYHTQDGSAAAGSKYESVEGVLVFEKGEFLKSIPLVVVQDTYFSGTTEFKVVLSLPDGCHLGSYMHTCRVKLIDDDPFPSQKYRDHLLNGKAGLQSVNGPGLFVEYFRLNMRNPGVAWYTLGVLIGDQMSNMYLYYTIWVSMYLVDVLFKTDDASTEANLWVPGSRTDTSISIGVMYIMPMIALHGWDVIKIKWDLPGKSQLFLQEILLRRYLNYSEDSRAEIKPSDVLVCVTEDAREVAEAYGGLLSVFQLFGKLGILTYFIYKENRKALYLAGVMPVIMLSIAVYRFKHLEEACTVVGDKEVELIALTDETCSRYRIVADYWKRPQMNDLLRKKVRALTKAMKDERLVRAHNSNVPSWVGAIFIGLYIATRAETVIDGGVSVGTFLATMRILNHISEDFSEMYALTMQFSSAMEPLKSITQLLNMPTDLKCYMASCNYARDYTRERLAEALASPLPTLAAKEGAPFVHDRLRIEMHNVSFRYTAFNGETDWVLREVTFSAQQGQLVAIIGDHGGGKATFMKILGRVIFPKEGDGDLVIPSHLRCLHVTQEPVLLGLTLWENLVFGCQRPLPDPERIIQILEGLEMPKTLDFFKCELQRFRTKHGKWRRSNSKVTASTPKKGGMKTAQRAKTLGANGVMSDAIHEVGEDEESESEASEDDAPVEDEYSEENWQEALTYTDRAKVHLARSLIVDPELLVLQRPLYHYHAHTAHSIISVFKEFTTQKGYKLPNEDFHMRRPRTLFFTPETVDQLSYADSIWHLDMTTHRLSEVTDLNSITEDFALKTPLAPPADGRTTDVEATPQDADMVPGERQGISNGVGLPVPSAAMTNGSGLPGSPSFRDLLSAQIGLASSRPDMRSVQVANLYRKLPGHEAKVGQ